MTQELLLTFVATMEVFRPALTRPGFSNLMAITVGWVLAPGAITYGLVATALSGVTHHEKFHRFLSRGSWDPDALGYRVFSLFSQCLPVGQAIAMVIDDTVTAMGGRLMRRWVLEPLVVADEIWVRQDAVRELVDDQERRDRLRTR